MIQVYTGERDTQCPITLATAHELKHPVVFNNRPDLPFELDALVCWMMIKTFLPNVWHLFKQLRLCLVMD